MVWLNFLHCYQPVNTEVYIIKEATEKSYERIIRALEEHPDIKFTLNINGSLFLRWEDLSYGNLIKRIGKLIQKGQIDLTGTACYHPLLPLVPKKEVERQIKENEEILKKHFGQDFKPKGFFMPEMAYNSEVAQLVKEMGYEWIILDEIAFNGKLEEVDFNKAYLDENSGLKVVFRSRALSSNYVPETILRLVEKDEEGIFITATDGELYGLRHEDPTAEFEKLLNKKIQTKTISEFIKKNKDLIKIKVVDCNWESTEKELKNNKPYSLWIDAEKEIQHKIWALANLAYEVAEKYPDDNNAYWARWHLVRGLASCTFWWASERDFSHIFGPQAWNPDEIERGINELIRSVRAIEDEATREDKIAAEELYLNIKSLIWHKHWTYYWKK